MKDFPAAYPCKTCIIKMYCGLSAMFSLGTWYWSEMWQCSPAQVIREDANSVWHASKTHLTVAHHLQPPTTTDQFLQQARLPRVPVHMLSWHSLFQVQSSLLEMNWGSLSKSSSLTVACQKHLTSEGPLNASTGLQHMLQSTNLILYLSFRRVTELLV